MRHYHNLEIPYIGDVVRLQDGYAPSVITHDLGGREVLVQYLASGKEFRQHRARLVPFDGYLTRDARLSLHRIRRYQLRSPRQTSFQETIAAEPTQVSVVGFRETELGGYVAVLSDGQELKGVQRIEVVPEGLSVAEVQVQP
jgi:hypothetical protein